MSVYSKRTIPNGRWANGYDESIQKGSRYSDENEETTILTNLKHNTEQNKSGQMIRTALIFLQSPNHQGNQMTVFRAGGVELSHEDRRASRASGRGPALGRGDRTVRGMRGGNAGLVTRGSKNKPKRTSKPSQ